MTRLQMLAALGVAGAVFIAAAGWGLAWLLLRNVDRNLIDLGDLTSDDPAGATVDETLDRAGRYVTVEEHADEAIAIIRPRPQFRRLTAQDYGDAFGARRHTGRRS